MPEIQRHVLRQKVKQAGLSHRQLALATTASKEHVQNVLAGRRNPSVELTSRLARAVGCDVADLLTVPAAGEVSPVRLRRQAAGIKPTVLARTVGITYTHLNAIELGRKRPSARVLADLATALGCPAETLTQDAA